MCKDILCLDSNSGVYPSNGFLGVRIKHASTSVNLRYYLIRNDDCDSTVVSYISSGETIHLLIVGEHEGILRGDFVERLNLRDPRNQFDIKTCMNRQSEEKI
jgi:hypothetical protein